MAANKNNSRIPADNAELLRLYESGKTLKKIAEQYGVSKQAVHDRLRRAGYVARPSPPIPPTFDRKTLRSLYNEKGLTFVQIAEHLNASLDVVRAEMKRHGIARRYRSKYRPYLERLGVGDVVHIPWTAGSPHQTLKRMGNVLGIKISIRRMDGQVRVTRKG